MNYRPRWQLRLFELTAAAFFIAVALLARAAAVEAADQQLVASAAAEVALLADEDFDFFSDEPIEALDVIELPPEKSAWIRIGGPLTLIGFFFFLLGVFWWLVPFKDHTVDINLHGMPTGVKRGIAMATVLFGIAFCFGASEIWYMLGVYGSAEAYFAQMSLGKLIAFTHAHLFGFTTAFFIIGIPFSLHFNHLWPYQWIFPIGLAASVTDVMSWWGIKYGHINFEWVSMFCGILFSLSYLYMLVGLLRVLLFPEVIWATDKDREERLSERSASDAEARHQEGDF